MVDKEKKLILEMVEAGTITADDAEKLLNQTQGLPEVNESDLSINKRFLKVIIIEENTTKVNIKIPLALAEVGLKLIPKKELEIKGVELDIKNILQLIQEGANGELINIETTDNNKLLKVNVFID